MSYLLKTFIVAIIIIITPDYGWANAKASLDLATIQKSVIQIKSTKTTPDFRKPWLYDKEYNSRGSGFYIGDGRILTNAHVVTNARYVTVEKHLSPKTIKAKILFVAHDSDLALMTVDDKSFFDDLSPIPIGDIPLHGSPVFTVGYPTGGSELSVTKGIVSRISYRSYVHPEIISLPLIQVDSAVNPGNSGGPVIQDGKAIGVAFQGNRHAENTNYIIPTPIINYFLEDIKDGTYDGHPELGFYDDWDSLSNNDKRAFYKLPPEYQNNGVPIHKVMPWSPFHDVLKANDILLKVDSYAVGNDGKIAIFGERLSYTSAFDLKHYDDPIKLEVLRESKVISLDTTYKRPKPHINDLKLFTPPRFYIFGGLIFSVLSRNYLQSFGDSWYQDAPRHLRHLYHYWEFEPEFADHNEIVVLINHLPHKFNAASSEFINGVVTKVSGKPIESLEEIKSVLEVFDDGFVEFEFWQRHDSLVLNHKSLKSIDQSILKDFRIPTSSRF